MKEFKEGENFQLMSRNLSEEEIERFKQNWLKIMEWGGNGVVVLNGRKGNWVKIE